MLENVNDIVVLLWKYINQDLSTEQRSVLDEWVASSETNRKLLEKLDSEHLRAEVKEFDQLSDWFGKSMSEKFQKTLPTKTVPLPQKKMPWMRWSAAASIILAVSLGSYYLLINRESKHSETTSTFATNDVLPGRYKAKLTLDNGRTIILDSTMTGNITSQGNTDILNRDGQLVYLIVKDSSNNKPVFNILSTGRGESYPIILSDGTKVWLNNETAIRYPVTFSEKERRLEIISGEAYFEVAHSASMPFKVTVNGTEVEVLGTKFSIAAYSNEQSTKTSLLSGKVKVTYKKSDARILMPGQQANVDRKGSVDVVRNADVEGSVAWVRGNFHFEDADIHSVMRQLARWYDVETVFEGQISEEKIRGDINRNMPLSRVLYNLERIGNVKFKMKDKKIIIYP